jgi:ABC-2 type transport system permease protein
MTIFKREMKFGRNSLIIWGSSIGFMMLICVLMFPEMESQMGSVNDLFANMGSFTAAFGMDRLNFGTLMGFYGVECGNIVGIGGGLYAALVGIGALAKEEKEHTAEFLLTQPVSRSRVIYEKLMAVMSQVIIMNIAIVAISAISFLLIGEKLPLKEFTLLHTAYLLLQLEIAAVCFGISAFIKDSGMGIGLGLAIVLYFLNIIKNISDKAAFLKYFTPFAYAEPAEIISEASLNGTLITIGIACTALGIAAAFWRYNCKDISA